MSKLKFPTMLRKMWSGREVQEWIDTNVTRPQPNCRTCSHMYWTKATGVIGCESIVACIKGDLYQALPPVKVWLKND